MSLFRTTLGADFARLPPGLQKLHDQPGRWTGRAEVTRGTSWLARLLTRLAGFPPGGQVPLTFTITATDAGEVWTRDFGRHRTRSTLCAGPGGTLCEVFGPFRVTMRPAVTLGGLALTVTALHFLGLPCPKFLLPREASTEVALPGGVVGFDIRASLPGLGLLIRYRGEMAPT
ncbi:DUF4166 domain-containing protein [Tabrizicola fusiformis]|uniref:DUF4166 domain-containing protein n=1 Tax=Tabrizicola sp. SY72 TaxID=2741673 RepID=UPI0015730A83|nr:DUF4166 domain-containing protein [Tabrizicola sp. SY72]NTT84871.1 DUF4166 domain-containing protein [Tabrizicola sp. SY72]